MNKAFLFSILVFLTLSPAHAQKLYKWVDDAGNVTYQDQPPPGEDADAAYAEDLEVVEESKRAGDPGLAAAANAPITLFSIPVCDACDLVRNLLQKYNLPFTEKNANDGISVQDELMKLSGQLSVPLLSIGSEVVYGYSSQAILDQLAGAGYAVDGSSAGARSGTAEQTTLTPEQIEEQAALAAEQLTSELDEVVEDFDFPDEFPVDEAIPEDEQIKVQIISE